MQVTIQQLLQEHGFESSDKAIEWAVANGYQLREYIDFEANTQKEITADQAREVTQDHPEKVFINANPLGLENPTS